MVLLMLLTLAAHAQSVRVVRGAVVTESGEPLKGAAIITDKSEKYLLQEDGTFEIRISTMCKMLWFEADGYVTVSRDIDGQYMFVKMAVDQEAVKKAEREAKEKKELAKKAEQERLTALEKARKEEEAKARAEQAALEKAQKKEERMKKEAPYNERYRNKGIEHSVAISYSYPLAKCALIYHYSGYREYGVLHPFELDYTVSYRINRLVAAGAGAGLLFHAKSITIVNDSFSPVYGEFKERRLDIPVFGSVRLTPLRTRFRPVVGGACGYYLLSRTLMWEGDLGGEFRISSRTAAHLLLSVRSTPYPYFNEEAGMARYRSAISPSVKIGFSF